VGSTADDSERRFRSVFFDVGVGHILFAPDGRIELVNNAFSTLMGYSDVELRGQTLDALAYPDDRAAIVQEFTRLLAGEIRYLQVEKRFVRKDGRLLWELVSSSTIFDQRAQLTAIFSQVQDITARKHAEEALHDQTQTYEALLRAQSVLGEVIILSEKGVPIYVNEGLARVTGYEPGELAQLRSLYDLVPAEQRASLLETVQGSAGTDKAVRFEAPITRKDGVTVDLEVTNLQFQSGERTLTFTVARDITARKQAQRELEHQELHDALTGLPNRVLLRDRLDQAILFAGRSSGSVALLVIDLDQFKEVNDSAGHRAGDSLLQLVSQRLQASVRSSDTVARLGGDEFGIVLVGTDVAGAEREARKILDALERPFLVEDHALDIGASIGIAVHPAHGVDAESLLRRADIAMYVAKRSRHTLATFASRHEETPGVSRPELMAELRRAIQNGELLLDYQPIVTLKTSQVTGCEALVRWRHPVRGVVSPADFIPLAEQSGLIQPLTRWVLDSAVAQCRRWAERALPLSVSVNISMRNLLDPELPDIVARLLQAHGAEPMWLSLEVTENVIMAEPQRTAETLARLRHLGVALSIDDFGTGYSSLAYLQRLPVDQLKIDRGFIYPMATDAASAAIVRAAIDLAHNLHLAVVAEGVEDRSSWDLLVGLGCEMAQGYYISRPMPPGDVPAWVQHWSGPAAN
jgi:diguanylate cyclase (GGDEF)-like protein/PAS domain S-box-containing protein